MKVNSLKYGLLLFAGMATVSGYSQKAYPILVKLSMASGGEVLNKDLLKPDKFILITLTVKSKQQKVLQLPDGACWGADTAGPSVFAFQAQKLINGKYVEQVSNSRFDYPPEGNVDSLFYNDSREYKYPLNLLYAYSPGSYRIRVFCRFGMLGVGKDMYSNWVYFHSVN